MSRSGFNSKGFFPVSEKEMRSPSERVAARIRDLREAEKLNQSDFAERVGVSRSYVSDVENGRAKPTIDFVFKIVEAIGSRPGSNPLAAVGWLIAGLPSRKADQIEDHDPTWKLAALDHRAIGPALQAVLQAHSRESPSVDMMVQIFLHFMNIYYRVLAESKLRGTDTSEAHTAAALACRQALEATLPSAGE